MQLHKLLNIKEEKKLNETKYEVKKNHKNHRNILKLVRDIKTNKPMYFKSGIGWES